MAEPDVKEAHGEFEFLGHTYPVWGSSTGRAKTDDYDKGKFNRYAKLGDASDIIVDDLISKIKNDPESIEGRCSYASLIMMIYGVRVGNEDSAEGYVSGLDKNKGDVVQTYGTTTLLKNHIKFQSGKMFLNFLGKEQVKHDIIISEPFLINIGKRYWNNRQDNDKWIGIDYDILFKFVKKKIGKSFIPKDLRTFCANVTGWNEMEKYLTKSSSSSKKDINKEVATIVEVVAKRLGNTPSIARSRYLDSRMINWFKAERFTEEKENGGTSKTKS